MNQHTRRSFLTTLAALAATAGFSLPNTHSQKTMAHKPKQQLVHQVYFWLKNSSSKEDLAKLLEGINSLRTINSLRLVKIGTPAATEKRDVIDTSYSVALLTVFDDIKGHDEYQVHPTHLAFVEGYKHLWEKVVVYDSMEL